MEYTCRYPSPLGPILLASDGAALTGLWFEGQKYFARSLDPDHREGEAGPLVLAQKWLDVYFSGGKPDFQVPLGLRGTPFQLQVWQALLRIPYGQTCTYGEIARRLGEKRGGPLPAQAVGGAVGRNRISLFIPCHRVVGANGSLTGYAGGISRKAALLKLEGAFQKGFFVPPPTGAP